MQRKPRQLKNEELSNQIIKLLSKNAKISFTPIQVSKKINVANPVPAIKGELDKLVSEKKVYKSENDVYTWGSPKNQKKRSSSGSTKQFQGYVDMTKSGAAYITGSESLDDIYVPPKFINGALHKDVVIVEINTNNRSRRPEGKIIRIVERSITHIIGSIQILDDNAIVFADFQKNFPEVYIKLSDTLDVKTGAKVKVEIIHWSTNQNKPIWGKVIRVLDGTDENDMAMQNILLGNGFDLDFSEEALAESESLHSRINETETSKRRDFRKDICFTIDPLTAKDFDDAISIKNLENGHYEIGVHIADVSHFLTQDSILDKEALDRSTSVYLADRVCPMLPESLSNDLCSLNPHEDKYTFSAVFEIDAQGKIYDSWFGKTIIHSHRRFTYEEAQERIETKEGDFADEILTLHNIALALRKQRYAEGAISFESDEIQFVFDEKFVPIGIKIRERKDAHMLVEDYMLLANKKVAEYISKKAQLEIPFVYRVHDAPNPDKLSDFALFAKELGFQFDLSNPKKMINSFNKLAEQSKENELLKLLEPLAIRTMAKAEYTTNNIGHFGLGFDFYTHFTSPIRRYSDVLVHRILFQNLKNEHRVDKAILELKTKHISMQERKAMDCERESIKYKLAEFMSFHIGEIYDGIISGVIEKGFFVEIIETKAEGFINFEQLPGVFTITENRFKAVNRSAGISYTMGQRVKVKVISSDKSTRKIDLQLM